MSQSLHFLIVEDDATSADAMRMLLERRGHGVQVCLDALSAVDLIDRQRPDVALIDIMMPGLDGVELCRRIRSLPKLDRCKLVVVTGKVYEADRARALSAGARGVIAKPIDPQTFVDDVFAHVKDDVVLTYWGVRGVMPMPGPRAYRYGGHTACVTLDLPGEQRLIFDAGTGIKALSDAIEKEGTSQIAARLLISHPHWDHINGLPQFAPLFVRGNEFEIMGPAQGDVTIRHAIGMQFDALYSAITMRDLAARVFFRDLAEATYRLGGCKVRTLLLAHPGNCLAYRVDYQGRSFCYVSDTELPSPGTESYNPDFEGRICDFIAGADVAVIDSAYGDARLPSHRPRGNGVIARLAEVAHGAKVKDLQLFHHGPDEDDDAIDAKLAKARSVLDALGSSTICTAPAEGTRRIISAPANPNHDGLKRVA